MIKIVDIRDGTSNTYLLGEKYLNPDNYANGNDAGDNEDAMMGYNQDTGRWTTNSPAHPPDRRHPPRFSGSGGFGSAHPVGFQMAFCDGSGG